MTKLFTDCLWTNFGAAIDMLTRIVALCPDALWVRDNEIEMHGLCPSLVMNYTVLDILFYNFRHVQHHVGQLNLLLRERAGVAAEWIAQAL